MNFELIKERTGPLDNKVSPVSESSLDPISDLIIVEFYKKGDMFIDRGKKITRNTLFTKAPAGAFYLARMVRK